MNWLLNSLQGLNRSITLRSGNSVCLKFSRGA